MEAVIHPSSLRAVAYEVLNQLYGGAAVDDSNIRIHQIEPELKHQYGLLLEKDDRERLKLGQLPEASRVMVRPIVLLSSDCNDCDPDERWANLPDYLSWNGEPYIKSVSACGIRFVPVKSTRQLISESKRTNRPTYVLLGNFETGYTIKTHMTERTVAVDEVEVEGAYKDPYFGLERNDPVFWQRPWAISEAYKALIKERAEIRLRGGSVATWQRSDKRNNGVETPINAPTT